VYRNANIETDRVLIFAGTT